MKYFPKRQQGTVLITVVLIAAFVIVLVLEAIKEVKFQKQLSSNLINRDQAYAYLMGMEELGKVLLKRAFVASKEDKVHLNQPWAQEEIVFPIDGGLMTAEIKDMQSCFNLNSIAALSGKNNNPNGNQPPAQPGGKSPQDNEPPTPPLGDDAGVDLPGQLIFEKILQDTLENTETRVDELAVSVRDWIDGDSEPLDHRGAEDDYYMTLDPPYRAANSLMAHPSELITVKGFSHKVYQQIKSLVCVLPDQVEQINVNTVDPDNALVILASLSPKAGKRSNQVDLGDIKRALSERGDQGFDDVQAFITALGKNNISVSKERLSVTSHYFQVTAKAEIGRTQVAMQTLFKRDDENNFAVVSRYFGRE